MAQFNVPSETARNSLVVETFRGVDLNNSPSNVDKSRSPAAPNMIRDQVGKVRKRMGYTTKLTAPEGAAINGVHHLLEETLIHAGAKLYRLVKATEGTWSLTEIGAMANARSRSFVFDQKLYLLDSATYQVYDGETLSAVADNATVPTIIISRRPTGGGQVYEGLNLLGKKWTESFLGTADATEYQLTTKELSDDPVTAKILDAEGNWVDKVENTDFTVDREKGIVTFTTAPGESPVKGQDNVQITASKVREDYLDAINKCTIAAVYGVGGSTDRVFLSGNAAKPGIDWYSNFEDPAFFPDTSYTKLVRDGGEVTGYAVLSNTLAAFINGASDERNVVVRGGTLDEDGDALFRVSNTMIGQDAVAPDTFCRTDMLFYVIEHGAGQSNSQDSNGDDSPFLLLNGHFGRIGHRGMISAGADLASGQETATGRTGIPSFSDGQWSVRLCGCGLRRWHRDILRFYRRLGHGRLCRRDCNHTALAENDKADEIENGAEDQHGNSET